MLQSLKTFFSSRSSFAHGVTVVVSALIGFYYSDAAFHSLVLEGFHALPAPVRAIVAIVAASGLNYFNSQRPVKIDASKIVAPLLIAAGILAFPGAVCAQNGFSVNVSTTADAVHYHGGYTAGTTEWALADVKDSSADSNGYVNSLYVGGFGRLYEAAGFTTYGGVAEVVPSKLLASFLKSTNIPADSFRVYVRGGIGRTTPTSGTPFVTGTAGAGIDYALTSSGSVTWNTFYVDWQNPGVISYKTGVTFSTATASQSAKSAKLRRLAARLR